MCEGALVFALLALTLFELVIVKCERRGEERPAPELF
jgi:hypothetical protein